MWSMDYITNLLQKNNIKTHIETSGAYSFSGKWDWFCLSPKKTKLPLDDVSLRPPMLMLILVLIPLLLESVTVPSKPGDTSFLPLQVMS